MLTSAHHKLTALCRSSPALLALSSLHGNPSWNSPSPSSNHDYTCGEWSPPRPIVKYSPETPALCSGGSDECQASANPCFLGTSRSPCPLPGAVSASPQARSFSTGAAAVEAAAEETAHEESGSGSSTNKGILVELGIVPPYNPGEEEEAMKHETIWARHRPKSGKINAKWERCVGRVPAVLFPQDGAHIKGNKELISIPITQVGALLRKYGKTKFMSRTFEMRFADEAWENEAEGGRVERVLPKSVQSHPASDDLMNLTFLRMPAAPGARVKVQVPLQFIGEDACPGIRKGGWLFCMRRVVHLECPWEGIPPHIEVDLSEMKVGQVLRLAELNISSSCRLLVHNKDLPVCKIAGSRSLNVAE